MDREEMRKAFEEWAKQNLLPLTEWVDIHGPYYADQQTYAAWRAWQAAMAHSCADKAELVEALQRAESAMTYSAATVSPGNSGERQGEWVLVHAGRAGSSYRQLLSATELAHTTLSRHGG